MDILKSKCIRHHLHRVLLLEHKHIRCENFFRMYKMNCNQDLEVCRICPYKTEIKGSVNALKHALTTRFSIMTRYGVLKTESRKTTFQSEEF